MGLFQDLYRILKQSQSNYHKIKMELYYHTKICAYLRSKHIGIEIQWLRSQIGTNLGTLVQGFRSGSKIIRCYLNPMTSMYPNPDTLVSD